METVNGHCLHELIYPTLQRRQIDRKSLNALAFYCAESPAILLHCMTPGLKSWEKRRKNRPVLPLTLFLASAGFFFFGGGE